MRTYMLHNQVVNVSIESYRNGRPSISIYDMDGMPFLTATINVIERSLEEDEVIIKDYSENQGIYKWLLEKNIVGKAVGWHQLAFERVPICKLNPEEDWIKERVNYIDDYID